MFPVSNYCIVTCMPLVRKTSSGTLCLTICLRYWFFWCSSRSRMFSSLRAQTYSTVQYSAVQYSTVQNRTAQTFLSRETSTSVTTIRETVSRATFHRYLHMRSEVIIIMYTSVHRALHWEACALRRSPGPRPPLLLSVGQHGLGGQHGQPAGPRLLGPEDVADLDHGRTPDTRLSLGRQSTSQ